MNYIDFIESKHFKIIESGFDETIDNPILFDYQKACITWALKKGRSALFLDTGLGKTICELEWASKVTKHTNEPVLILAPLSVSKQIHREASKYGYKTNIIRGNDEIRDGINICNYEILHNIDCSNFSGVVLDESSILKGFDGKYRKLITDSFLKTPYKLSASATPSPNDFMEIGTQSEFLGILSQTEMLATFFIHDGSDTSKWRLKGHGKKRFFEWMSTWAIIMRDPSDYGFDKKPDLPPLIIASHVIDSGIKDDLLPKIAQSMLDRNAARKETVIDRCRKAAEIASKLTGPVIIWCGLNDEGDTLKCMIEEAVQVKGADTNDHKEKTLTDFSEGKLRILITKPKIAGFGMNWQHCSDMIFVGLSDSWEQYYQAVRRCWRFGQTNAVHVHIITADIEGMVINNIKRKSDQANIMMNEMAKIASGSFHEFGTKTTSGIKIYNAQKTAPLPKWASPL